MPKTIFLVWDTSKINFKKYHISTHCCPDEVDHFYVSIVIQILTRKKQTNKRQKKQKVKSIISRTLLPTEAACWVGGGHAGSTYCIFWWHRPDSPGARLSSAAALLPQSSAPWGHTQCGNNWNTGRITVCQHQEHTQGRTKHLNKAGSQKPKREK